jgi:hypothetical protein
MADGMSEPPNIARAADEHAAEASLHQALPIQSHARSSSAVSSPHARKFLAITVLLVGLALGAVTVAISMLTSGNQSAPSGPWSQWTPPDTGMLGASDIANHIAPFYRLSGTDQLAVVSVVHLGNANSTSSTSAASSGLQVALPTTQSSSSSSSASSSGLGLLGGNTIAYNLCGVGSTDCSIGIGTPSSNRTLLLRREALELALYTFKYVSSTDNVLAILPTTHTTSNTLTATPHPKLKPVHLAVLFEHQELQPFLDQPLAATYQEQYPPLLSQMATWKQTTEAALVDQITARGLFTEQIEHAQDGSSLMILNQVPPS